MKKFFEALGAVLFVVVLLAWVAVCVLAAPALLKLCITYLFF